MTDLNSIVDILSGLTLVEAAELTNKLREKWGIVESVSPLMRGPNELVTTVETAVEQSLFAVVLREIGPKKIDVIKVVRQIDSHLGLREAKNLVETPKARIVEEVDKNRAAEVRALLESAGAVVEIV